jgi:hypothetical protein
MLATFTQAQLQKLLELLPDCQELSESCSH